MTLSFSYQNVSYSNKIPKIKNLSQLSRNVLYFAPILKFCDKFKELENEDTLFKTCLFSIVKNSYRKPAFSGAWVIARIFDVATLY
jgi:hypothetical protein